MPKHRITYGKMNKDIHPSKVTQEIFYDARDVRINLTDDNDNGSLTPQRGTEFKFNIATRIVNEGANSRFALYFDESSTATYVEYEPGIHNSVEDSLNLTIIGHTVIGEVLVLISCSSNGNGQIWKYENGVLNLLHNSFLDLSISNPIRGIKNRVENDATYKIYWTDNYNTLRYCNVLDPNLINRVSDYFDIVPNTIFTKPQFVSNTSGGDFSPGMVQYGYTLYNFSGSESKLSPLSNLVTMKNVDSDGNVKKALEFSIDLLSNTYENIKVYRIHYTEYNQEPIVTLIYNEEVANSPSFSFVDDGIISIAQLSTEEVTFLGSEAFKCKAIEVYKNKLIPANITIDNFEVDIDTRAYRFNSSGTAELHGNNVITINNPVSDLVPIDHDAINPSNKAETNLDYRNNVGNTNPYYNEFIYQSNGIVLGGEGPIISYQIKTDTFSTFTPNSGPGLLPESGTYAKPGFSKIKASLKRDEVYRFAIRFVNSKGQRTFAKWIGDIRMPNQDTHPISTESGVVNFHPLYVEFTIKTASIPSDVIGYEILRAERGDKDKTIVAQGIVNTMIESPGTPEWAGSSNYSGALQPSYCFRTIHDNSSVASDGYSIELNKNISDNGEIPASGRPVGDQYKLETRLLQIHSPELSISEVEFSDTWRLNIVGGISELVGSTYIYDDDKNSLTGIFSTASYNLFNNFFTAPFKYLSVNRKFGAMNSLEIASIPIAGGKTVGVGDNFNSHSFNSDNGTIDFRDTVFINNDETDNDKCISYIDKSLVVDIEESSSLGIDKVVSNGGNILFTTDTVPKVIVTDIKRDVLKQYGGDRYEDRVRTIYQVVESSKSNVIPVFNGDTFINYAPLYRSMTHSPDTFVEVSYRDTMLVPLETSQNLDAKDNLELSTDNSLKKIDQTFDEELYKYNQVYESSNNLLITTERPFNFLSISKFTNRLLASETKINGEEVDSWLQYRTNDFLDIEGSHGEIQALQEFNNTVFAFQDKGIARMLLQPNVQVSGAEGTQVQLGLGSFLHDYNYISTNSGTQNQFSVLRSANGIYYYDTINNKFKLLGRGDQYISDVKGLHSHLNTSILRSEIMEDNPFNDGGISTFYNPKTLTAYFTVKTRNYSDTISYLELNNGFGPFYSYLPSMSIYMNGDVLLVDSSLNQLHELGKGPYASYFGTSYNPSVTVIANPAAVQSKVFDTITFDSIYNEPDDITQILKEFEVWNSYQSSGVLSITPSNLKRRFREWRLNIPRVQNSRNRFVGNYLYTKLVFNEAKYFSLSDVVFDYLPTSI